MINDLLLLSGNDIPFEQAQLIIHQPTIKEIAYIGEENFYTGLEFLRFSKDKLNGEDKKGLSNYSNFEVIMILIGEQNPTIQKSKISVLMVLSLLFPQYQFSFEKDYISLKQDDNEFSRIDNSNFEDFLLIINEMFCLGGKQGEEFNPAGEYASRIAEKLKKRKQKLAEIKSQDTKIAILGRYISILSVGLQKNMNDLLNYTIYQLFDEFKRYNLKINFDFYMQARFAGAKDLKEVDDWMSDIHSEK